MGQTVAILIAWVIVLLLADRALCRRRKATPKRMASEQAALAQTHDRR